MPYLSKTPLAFAGLSLVLSPVQAATLFTTNTSGNASALNGDNAGTTTPLTLSGADGGGTINVFTIGAFNGANPQNLSMDADSLGVGNDKWGNTNQRWLFSLDQTVSFDSLGFFGTSQGMILTSAAWKDDANASGANWNFTSDGTIGTFAFNSGNGPTFDFTSSGVSNVAAGTEIRITHVSGAGGAQMASFTITPIVSTPIPEPSTSALLGLAGITLLLRRQK